LQAIPFDLLLTFTNKISSYLRYYQFDYVKVSFHLTQEDISTLRQMGLSRAKKKIAIETFIEESRNLADSELRQYLETRYPEIFI
jgi:pyruvate kinase